MSQQNNDQEFLAAIKQQLDESEQSLPADTLSQLRQSRHAALQQLNKPSRYWKPAAAVAMAMSVVITVIGLQVLTTDRVGPTHSLEDLPVLSASEELELYEELEFYQWLEFEERAG